VKVSVVIPTRNRRAYLAASLASAQQQTFRDLEILVSDDGSQDGSAEFVLAQAGLDPRVRLAPPNPSPGAFNNIRHLINHAHGDAIAVLGDDDILEPRFVEALAAGLADAEVNVAYCMHDVIDGAGLLDRRKTAVLWDSHAYAANRPGRVEASVEVALMGQMWLGSCLFRTSALRQTTFRSESGAAADWDIAIELATRAPAYFVPEVLWHYRSHAATISRLRELEARRAAITVLDRYGFSDPGLEALRRRVLRKRLTGLAWFSLEEGGAAARQALQRYRKEGGSSLNFRYIVIASILLFPDAAIRSVHTLANRLRSLVFPGQY